APCSDTSWVVVSDAVAAMDSCAVPVEPVVVSDALNSLNDACAAMGLAEQSRGKPVILALDHLIPGHDEDDLSSQSYRNRAPVDELRGSSHTVQPLAKDFFPPFLFKDSEICNANVACFIEDSFNFVSWEHQNRLVDIPFQPQMGHAVERAFTVDMLSQSLPDHVIWHAATVAALEVTPLWTCEDIAKVHMFTDGSFKRQKDGAESATWALVALGEVQALPGRLTSHEPKLVRLGVASGNVSLDQRFPWPKPKLSAAIAEHMALFFAALLACSLPTGVAVEISFDSETAGFSAAGLASAAADNPLAGFVRSLVLHAHNRFADASAMRSFRVVGKCATYNAMTLREEGKICLTAEQFHKSGCAVVGIQEARGKHTGLSSVGAYMRVVSAADDRLAGVVKSKKAVLSASFDQSGQPIITWKGPNNAQACLDYIMLPHNWSGPDSTTETLDMFENCMSITDHVPLTFTTLGEHECTVSSCRKLDPGLDVGQMLTKEGRVKCEQILDSVPAIPWATDSTDHWSRVSGFILQRLKEEFPRPQRRPRKSCIGHETWQLIQKRRAARRDIHCFHKAVHVTRLASVFVRWREWTHGQHVVRRESLPSFIKRMNKAIAVASYRIHSTTKDLKKALVADKADFVLQLVANQFTLGPRAFHACLRQMTGSRKARRPNAMQALKRPDGTSVRCRAEAVDVLAGHYACVERGLEVTGEALTLAHAHASDVGLLQGCSDLHSVPTWYRVESACRELQSHKAVGMDGIPGELYKVAPRAATAVLMPVLLKTWLRHEPPLQWLGGEVVPTPKHGADLTHPKSWRNIMLYDTAAKIYQKLLRAEIREHWRAQDMQCGARPGISTEMPHHLVASFIRYAKRAKFPAAILFVDGQDAFYAVFRQVILGESTSAACTFVQAMTDDPQRQADMLELICSLRRKEVTGLPPHVVQRLRDAMSTTWFRVRGSPKVIHTTSGASPGGPLADLCFQVGFSFFLDRLHQDLRDLGAAACLLNDGDAECEMPIPTWVDDIALLITHPCPEQLAELVPVVADRCRRRLQNIGIQMNM
ncbi:unnamed protein product, partial [Durusdinium trenchii]